MIQTGKCPKCEKVLLNVTIQAMPIHEGFQPRWKGVSYLCPTCHTILGVQMDPITLITDTVSDLVKALGR